MSNEDAPETADTRPAVGGPVQRMVRPGGEARAMVDAPLDGTLVQLLVRFDHNGIEDTNDPTWTIGSHNDGEWNFVGWCWHTDQWARGSGDLLEWLPIGPNVGINRHCPVRSNDDN